MAFLCSLCTERLILIDFWEARPECLCAPIGSAASQNRSTLLHFCSFHARGEQGNAMMCRFSNSWAMGVHWGGLAEGVTNGAVKVTEPRFDVLCRTSCRNALAAAAAAAAAAAWYEHGSPWSSPASSSFWWPCKPGTPRLLQDKCKEQVGRQRASTQP